VEGGRRRRRRGEEEGGGTVGGDILVGRKEGQGHSLPFLPSQFVNYGWVPSCQAPVPPEFMSRPHPAHYPTCHPHH